MNDKTIRVLINPDGISCREVNPLGEMEPDIISTPLSWDSESLFADQVRWRKTEASLRSFEVENNQWDYDANMDDEGNVHILDSKFWLYKPGTIHEAEILDNGKVKILTP